MSVTALAAALLLGQSAFSLGIDRAAPDVADVAYSELSAGQSQAAVRKLEAEAAVASNDPAVLINLGAAYAREGQSAKALTAYRAAVASPVRYDLQLANGTWVDSRAAAKMALNGLLASTRMAAR